MLTYKQVLRADRLLHQVGGARCLDRETLPKVAKPKTGKKNRSKQKSVSKGGSDDQIINRRRTHPFKPRS